MKKVGRINKDSKSYAIIKGFIFALIIGLICVFMYAVILVNTTISENTIKPVIITITGVSILIGSSISSLKIKKKGIVNGMCVAILYLGSFYILSSIVLCGFYLNLYSIINILAGITLGGIGGIIGVNLRRQ